MHKLVAYDRSGARHDFFYDPEQASLVDASGESLVVPSPKTYHPVFSTSPEHPQGKTRSLRRIRISMGLACNYQCAYCAQKDISRTRTATKAETLEFLAKLPSWYDGGKDGKGQGTLFEFWGGEPLVYWKTLKLLAEGIREMYPNADFLIFTNGSLMTMDKAEWFDRLGFSLVLSHDGPGQHIRGRDPLKEPVSREALLWLYNRLAHKGRMSINSVLTAENYDVAKIVEFFQEATGDADVVVGDCEFMSFFSKDGRDEFEAKLPEMQQSLYSAALTGKTRNIVYFNKRVADFLVHLISQRPASSYPQVCSMDTPSHIAVNLHGDVLTCQNASEVDEAVNGTHKIGSVDDFDNIKLTTAKHWGHRPHCQGCPFVAICQGGCMSTTDEDHAFNCKVKKIYCSVVLAAALYEATGMMLSEIVPVKET